MLFDAFAAPMAEGMPKGTYFDCGWMAGRDAYALELYTPAFGISSAATINGRDLALMDRHQSGFIALLQHKAAALRQRHHFACVYARGGYC